MSRDKRPDTKNTSLGSQTRAAWECGGWITEAAALPSPLPLPSHLPAKSAILNPRQWRGCWCNPPPPWVFLNCTLNGLEYHAEISIAYGASFAQLLVKNLVRSGQVTKLWRHKGNNLRQDFNEIVSKRNLGVVRLTWMGTVDVIGVNTWLGVTLDPASHEFQGHLRLPEVTDLGWPHNDQ